MSLIIDFSILFAPKKHVINSKISFVLIVVRRCPSLSSPRYGFIYPRMCKSSPVSGTACYFECRNGFLENGGETVVYCENDGKWSKNISSILKCLGKLLRFLVEELPWRHCHNWSCFTLSWLVEFIDVCRRLNK